MDSKLITDIQQKTSTKDLATLPRIRTGMEVEIHQRITEGGKSRIQKFRGLVIKSVGKTIGEKAFTVRREVNNHGIERVFPVACPTLEKIDIIRQYKVRRKNIGYIKSLQGNAARLKERKKV